MGGYTIRAAWEQLVKIWDNRESKRLLIQKKEYQDGLHDSIVEIRAAHFKAQQRIADLEWQLAQTAGSETIASVTAWANETFGKANIITQLHRAEKEWDELQRLVETHCSYDQIAEEAADVVICLYRVIGTLDPEAINKKMTKNRARKWIVDGNGCAQHVGEE